MSRELAFAHLVTQAPPPNEYDLGEWKATRRNKFRVDDETLAQAQALITASKACVAATGREPGPPSEALEKAGRVVGNMRALRDHPEMITTGPALELFLREEWPAIWAHRMLARYEASSLAEQPKEE